MCILVYKQDQRLNVKLTDLNFSYVYVINTDQY